MSYSNLGEGFGFNPENVNALGQAVSDGEQAIIDGLPAIILNNFALELSEKWFSTRAVKFGGVLRENIGKLISNIAVIFHNYNVTIEGVAVAWANSHETAVTLNIPDITATNYGSAAVTSQFEGLFKEISPNGDIVILESVTEPLSRLAATKDAIEGLVTENVSTIQTTGSFLGGRQDEECRNLLNSTSVKIGEFFQEIADSINTIVTEELAEQQAKAAEQVSSIAAADLTGGGSVSSGSNA